jgi:DNA-binding LacI/PurR family transcriptional regulator
MTVSRALRTPEQVSDKLREKIDAAVHELGYMPNLAASALASASSWTIAMVVPNLAEAGCSEMFAGLQQVLQPAGYQIMLAESQHRLEQEEKLMIINTSRGGLVDSQAAIEALKTQKIGALGMDVYENERDRL